MENLQVIFEDAEILVINKPSGMVVNRSVTQTAGDTLQDLLEESDPGSFDSYEEDDDSDFAQRSGIVHRLDKDTSGVMVIAKTKQAYDHLQSQFKERNTKKEYIALVNGKLAQDLIEIDAPIKRHPRNFMKYAVATGGKEAFTRIEKLDDYTSGNTHFTLVRVLPRTGRTHQIRVHLSAMNAPVVCDPLYCSQGVLENNLRYYNRLMLHAKTLELTHPTTGERMEFTADLPKVFDKSLLPNIM